MKDLLLSLKEKALKAIPECRCLTDLEDKKTHFLGKKGALTQALKQVVSLPKEERPKMGQLANTIKNVLLTAFDEQQSQLEDAALNAAISKEPFDVSLPEEHSGIGRVHPIDKVIDEVSDIFAGLGFTIKVGPDIESDWHNFEALNIPKDHPARDMHDTFYINEHLLLRTHTSPVQIRTMLDEKPPIRLLAPGKVYRCDADASHSPVFHQIEGLVIEPNISFSHLKATLTLFLQTLFGKDSSVRFRSSYFPFTEPSVEVDVQCVMCSGKGCRLCKDTGWLEIMGAGMVNHRVLTHTNIDPNQYSGFAFGMGVERIAMLKYHIHDIRLFYENDYRFITQF